MRLLYLSVSYIPSRSASSVHAMRMCAALARAGHDVELVSKSCRARQEAGVADPFAFYGVPRSFRLAPLPRPAWRGGGLRYLAAISSLLGRRADVDLVYARDLAGACLAVRRGRRVVFEAHGPPADPVSRWWFGWLLRSPRTRRLVVISRALHDLLDLDGLAFRGTTVVAHDAADALPGTLPAPAPAPRLRAGYVGSFYPGRGVDLVVELARRLPSIEFHLVGGNGRELALAGIDPANLRPHGFVPPSDLPALYAGFDILLMPYQRVVGARSGRVNTAPWMSPMKMFEYMAAGRAIVSSDLPVLREVLSDRSNALLVPPDDAGAWEAALGELAADAALRRRLGEAAQEDFLARHTWDARARAVLEGLEP